MALVHDYGVESGERVQTQHLRPQLIVQDAGILQQQRLQLSREWDKNKYRRPNAVLYYITVLGIRTPSKSRQNLLPVNTKIYKIKDLIKIYI